jgi:PBP1b-binding outer membrane lipoprotein LpoB
MKRILLFSMILASVLFFAGCIAPTVPSEDITIKINDFGQIENGDLLINVQLENIGDKLIVVDKICFKISFEDSTTIEKDINVGITLLLGEEKNEGIVVIMFSDKSVSSVEIKSYEFY